MNAIRCIIADDEPLAVELLRNYVKRDERLELVGAYTDAHSALEAIKQGKAELAILDIQMPDLSGIEMARAADEMGVRVIFVTAYREYALDGFKVHAADYLLKPVSRAEFAEAIDRICRSALPAVQYLTVRSEYRLVRLPFNEILYIEGLKDYVKIYVSGRERPVITQMSMKSIEQALAGDTFVRIHRSFIVAKARIEAYDRTTVYIGGNALPIGDTYRHRFATEIDS